MATIKLMLDKRTVRKDGTSPLKLAVSHKGDTAYVALNCYVPVLNWDATARKVIGLPNRAMLNSYIIQRRMNAESALMQLAIDGKLPAMDVRQLRDALASFGRESDPEPEPENNGFAFAFKRFIGQKEKPRTRETYQSTLAKLYAFCPKLDSIRYEEITKGWLTDFDIFMAKTSPARNARNIHLRNIRAVFNFALDEEYTTAYPFRRFKIRPEETRKRCMSVEQLRTLRDYPCEEYQAKYRDMFLLTFYLIGINPMDLLQAKKSDVENGRLEYRRSKTGKLYSIKIEPEAQEIIDRYKGAGDYLLDVMERYGNYRDYLARWDRELKRIGEMRRVGLGGRKVITPLFPKLSAYWARHSWATIAYSIGVPKETISEALGHEIGSRITSIYIAFDSRKVDEANRKVIDYVLREK